jgi:lipoprotein-releasing system permease protein
LVGIALGVATLIVVMAVMTGFRETLITQIIGGSPHVNVQSQTESFGNFDTVADQIRGVDGIEYVTPVVQGQVLATGNNRHSGVLVRGMRKADLERLIANAEPEVINGSLDDFTEDNGVALGANLAAKLGLRIGDFITLISPDGDITPFQATPMPRVKDYKIIQTFKLGVQEIDYNVAFMPFAEAQIYFNKQDQADTLDIFVADPQNVEQYSDPIFASSRSSISLYNWKNQNGRLIGAINLERQVMFVILTMIILVAALNIISGLVMLVKDKARDVAIMRTMGMARGSILRIFFICGSSIGVIGSLLGVLLGVLFVVNIHTIQGFVEWVTNTRVWDPSVRAGISEIPTKLQFSDVALTLFIALGLSFIATLFPAWKAAKLDPVEALRYE